MGKPYSLHLRKRVVAIERGCPPNRQPSRVWRRDQRTNRLDAGSRADRQRGPGPDGRS